MTLTNVDMDGAWTLQSLNTSLEGRQHDGGFWATADVQSTAMVPAQTWRSGVVPQASTNGTNASLLVTAMASPSLSLQVYPGTGIISRASQAVYQAYLDSGIVNPRCADADPTNPRLDLIVARVEDAAIGDSFTRAQIQVITGTPAGVPALPALPAGAIPLASARVNALATTITSANIVDLRKSSALQGAVRRLLPGDLLTDVGFRDGELRDTGTTLDRWTDTGATTGTWVTVKTYAESPLVVVGGNRYVTGATLASVSGGADVLTGTGTGSFPVVNGQAYEVEWGFAHQLSISADVFTVRIRDTNVSGAIQFEDNIENEPINRPLFKTYKFILKPTSTTTRTFVGTMARLSGTGGLDSKADSLGKSYFKVTRLGLATLITDV